MSYPIQSGKVSDSDSPVTVTLGASTAQRWKEITLQVFDDRERPVNTGATGTVTGQAVKSGTNNPEDFEESIDLATDDWSWKPELSTVSEFIFGISGLNAGYTLQFTINNWT